MRTARRQYSLAVVAVAMATAVTEVLRAWMGASVSLFFFPAIVIVAMQGGYAPAMVASVLSTLSLAFFFVRPFSSYDIGADDGLRLAAFAAVAIVTASLGSARERAEEAQRKSLEDLQGALNTLNKVSGWPVLVPLGLARGARRILRHAANVVGAATAVAVWEVEDEPWLYLASSSAQEDGVMKQAPSGDGSGVSAAVGAAARLLGGAPAASARFALEHLKGQVFFGGVDSAPADLKPLVQVVAREVGNSLDQMYVHERMQQMAVREDRLRVARDLHDGVLQSLTAIRFKLQALAEAEDAAPSAGERLLEIERAIAIEQRELRLFIDGLKPVARTPATGQLALHLEGLCARMAEEWNTPITVRVVPPSTALAPYLDAEVGLLVREATVNALKHAQPSRVSVEVDAMEPPRVQIVVSNDGRGFPFRGRREHADLVASNAGPVSLRERAMSLGGTVAIESTAAGSRLEIVVPAAPAVT